MDEYEEFDEFEAMYADDLEALRDQDYDEVPARKQLNVAKEKPAESQDLFDDDDFEQVPEVAVSQKSQVSKGGQSQQLFGDEFGACSSQQSRKFQSQKSFEDEFEPLSYEVEKQPKKRTIRALFGDIDDIIEDEIQLPKPKKLKDTGAVEERLEEYAMIEHIIELRRLAKAKSDPLAVFSGSYDLCTENFRDNISYIEPKYTAISIVNWEGVKIYLRFHSEQFQREEMQRFRSDLDSAAIMGEGFKRTMDEAKEILSKECRESNNVEEATKAIEEDKSLLWVDLYKPRKYLELLSDESTNRTLLKWLKLWDKIVFNRRPKVVPKKPQEEGKFKNRFELNLELDESGRPQHKVALLCGPPGLGKTTLAHMVASHAGYKVIEINASDDRSAESFRTSLENATQMTSVLDSEKRPNCLVFDEIDGAPTASIDFLIKYVNGAYVSKSKKGKAQKGSVLKRPIICICNDVYVPALRALRQIAFVVHFPPTKTARLAERLKEISNKERIKTDLGTLMALGEKSSNDIRSCLSFLHFFKFQKNFVTLSDVQKTSIGQKDMQKGLFSVWQDIFEIERPKAKGDLVTLGSRWNKVVSTISAFGDYERVAQGVFENYPTMQIKDSTLNSTCLALEWFCYSDIISTQIATLQNYSLTGYLQFGFVMWNYAFASFQKQKITYPNAGANARSGALKSKALMTEVLRGVRPGTRVFLGGKSVLLDVLPLLSRIVVPTLRPVNLHVFSKQEKDEMGRVVSTMIDYNLNYIQERQQDGTYSFNLDPDINGLVKFPNSRSDSRQLTYFNKQLIAHEIEVEKMRRVEAAKYVDGNRAPTEKTSKERPAPPPSAKIPKKPEKAAPFNFLQKRKKDSSKTGSGSAASSAAGEGSSKMEGLIWYKYKEGHTNAVRKRGHVSDWV
ncbi:PREDICTED: chromosome transmission fidelity protein 18 homolog [Nicrophorus vespilloides]|uniref:Chromosome transmission fidelity protein 18 homolog n=1 Tax=Nicrophorus vespilloides TaxID=110193 RepID=A0ABM1N1S5_NICVS|nr:PREDICTED: chromosome transmission fidelity protein 18 homolog [Nicrophorus vespilloides]